MPLNCQHLKYIILIMALLLCGIGKILGQTAQRYALDFDGTNDRGRLLPDGAFNHQPITYAFWFNIPSGGGGHVMGNGHNASKHGYGGVFINETQAFFAWTTSDVNPVGRDRFFQANGLSISTDTWHHFAAVMDFSGQSGTLYLDGEPLSASINATATDWTPETSAITTDYFGAREVNSILYFNGTLDEISVWSTALSATEIRDYMFRSIDSNHP